MSPLGRFALAGMMIALTACGGDSEVITTPPATPAIPSTSSAPDPTLPPEPAVALTATASVDGSDVIIKVQATGFDIRYVESDTSGSTAHVHAYVDQPPPRAGDNVPLGDPSIVHSTSSTITVRGLAPGDHEIWVIAADGNDDALVPPEPVRLSVTVP